MTRPEDVIAFFKDADAAMAEYVALISAAHDHVKAATDDRVTLSPDLRVAVRDQMLEGSLSQLLSGLKDFRGTSVTHRTAFRRALADPSKPTSVQTAEMLSADWIVNMTRSSERLLNERYDSRMLPEPMEHWRPLARAWQSIFGNPGVDADLHGRQVDALSEEVRQILIAGPNPWAS